MLYALCAVIATLTRETVWPAFAGFFAVLVLRSRHPAREAKVWAAGLALVAMPIWRVTLTALWSGAPRYGDHETILGLPFAGLVGRFEALLAPFGHTVPWRIEVANRSLFVLTAFPLLGALTVAVFRLRRAWRDPVMAPIAGAWGGQAALMSMVTADGPWVEPVAYGRAFSELFVLSCLVSGAGGRAHPRRILAVQAMAFAAMALACLLQLGF